MISIYTTCKDKKEAKKLADILLKKKLIVCANFWSVESRYRWKGKLESGKEYALLMKGKSKAKEIICEIEKNHSYDLPAIYIEKVEVSKKTGRWIKKEVR
jgi:periplasmic divalent cation tolerance protein